ncbi:MAG TPA: hypothetical protein DDX39_03360 [Bacteroidales bacterium]|nr:MAG: hypothetical protein A2W98_12960 [Bacteroidetes bacterium GWF2_33_38]OFY75999.1 MAG: hypothetical protein A2265_08055 [Bacteroidetes bacterium RIFOXYA12_FULL_33_9]OFY86085.1 MAG: hypothetical protein A2236_00580 [Bacteroidetes bacterium RIFOXYA2_FULL_33_7]HBF87658.1 hypothetical protein [Bacteroidales bacterium]
MKTPFRLFAIFSVLILITNACNFNYSNPFEDVNSKDNIVDFQLAKKALNYIENNKVDSLLLLYNQDAKKRIRLKDFKRLFKNGDYILSNYVYPEDSLVNLTKSTNKSMMGEKISKVFSFPFDLKNSTDSTRYFYITITNGEIQNISLSKLHPGLNFISSRHKEPHLEKIVLKTENIKWFRIWYDGTTYTNKRFRNENGFYAVSGSDSEDLNDIGIKKKFDSIFEYISKAEYDSLDYKDFGDHDPGEYEWIYLRMRFKNAPKKFKEFEVSCILKDDSTNTNELKDYIIFVHSNKTRYLLEKSRNIDLVTTLKEIAHYKYDEDDYEWRP